MTLREVINTTGKEFVMQPYTIAQRIGVIKMQIDAHRDAAEKITATLSDDVVSRSRNVHSLEDKMAAIVDLESRLEVLEREYAKARDSLKRVIDAVYPDDDLHNYILTARFLLFDKWAAIAIRADMTERRINQMCDEAVIAVDRYIDTGNG